MTPYSPIGAWRLAIVVLFVCRQNASEWDPRGPDARWFHDDGVAECHAVRVSDTEELGIGNDSASDGHPVASGVDLDEETLRLLRCSNHSVFPALRLYLHRRGSARVAALVIDLASSPAARAVLRPATAGERPDHPRGRVEFS